MTRITVITPCSRPSLLGRVGASVWAALGGSDFEWWVVAEARAEDAVRDACPAWGKVVGVAAGEYGHPHRDLANALLTCGWVHYLDDDTLMHPGMPEALRAGLEEDPVAGVVAFDQYLVGGALRLAAKDADGLNTVDTGSFASRWDVAKRGKWTGRGYDADGRVFYDLICESKLVRVSQAGSFYNALQPVTT